MCGRRVKKAYSFVEYVPSFLGHDNDGAEKHRPGRVSCTCGSLKMFCILPTVTY